MNVVPIDVDMFLADVKAVLDVVPVVDNRTGEHMTNRDDVPRWRLELLVTDDRNQKQVVTVGFTAIKPPEVIPGVMPNFDGLIARYWDFNGRSGMSLSAERIRFPAAAAAA